MPKYIPFLKAKANEFGAIKSLEKERKQLIAPFFDLALKKDMDEAILARVATGAARKFALNMKGVPEFFVDDYDIPDSILVGGRLGYEYFADCLYDEDLDFNPVVGIDRSTARQDCVFGASITRVVKNRRIALRVTGDDLASYKLVQKRILGLIARGQGIYDKWILVIDNRVCLNLDVAARASQIVDFCLAASADYAYEAIVISGSSLPPVTGDVIATNKDLHLSRKEMDIYSLAVKDLPGLNTIFGDYAVVSPDYSDSDIEPQNMLNVTAPKVVYSYEDKHYIVRGGAIKSHPRKFKQYNDIAAQIVSQGFFRHGFSAGDIFLADKAAGNGSTVMPGSILKPTINSHIAFMLSLL